MASFQLLAALGQPHFHALPPAGINHVRCDHEQQFIGFVHLAVGDHYFIDPRNCSEAGNSIQACVVRFGSPSQPPLRALHSPD